MAKKDVKNDDDAVIDFINRGFIELCDHSFVAAGEFNSELAAQLKSYAAFPVAEVRHKKRGRSNTFYWPLIVVSERHIHRHGKTARVIGFGANP